MGFLESKELIELNDLVILYINFNTIYPVSVKETILSKKGVEVENIYQTKYACMPALLTLRPDLTYSKDTVRNIQY